MGGESTRGRDHLSTVFDYSQVGGGLAILALAVISAAINYETVPAIFEVLKRSGSQLPSAYSASTILYLGFYLPLLLVSASVGLMFAVKGIRSLLIPDLPTTGSQPFRDYEEFRKGMQEHALSCYRPLGAFISGIFGARTMYLSPLRRAIVERNGEKLKRRLFWIVLALLAIFLVHQSVKDDADPNYGLALPFVWLIGLQIVMGVADFLSCILLVPRSEPKADSHEALESYKGFGHPTHLFSRLPDLGEKLRLGEQPNRTYISKSEKATTGVSDVGEFGGVFYIERHPQPLDAGRKDFAYVLLGAGWLLRLLGCYLLFFRALPAEIWELAAMGTAGRILALSPLFVIFMLLASASAWLGGGRYLTQAADVIRASWFSSVGILINVTGDHARADVAVGRADSDSLVSKNVAARSNFTARFWAAELISEAKVSTAPRELLALNRTEDSQRWIDHFKQGIHQLRDERVKPVGIEIDSAELSEIARANLGLFAERARINQGTPPAPQPQAEVAPPSPRLIENVPPPPGEPGVAPPGGVEDNKECPRCAETVRMRAKVCRYCGYDFGVS